MAWEGVAERRAHWDIDPIYVPITRAPGQCIGWGAPIVDGRYLEHP